jgi:hypothetical protein
VVVQHAGDDLADLLHVLEDLGADRRVALDLLELLGGQAAGLLQDGLGHADLADVVQQPGHVDLLDVAVAQADLARQVAADERDALAVAAGVGVLGVDRAGQAVQQAHHQAVHVLEQPGVLEVDRRLVGDRVQQLAVDRVELAVGLVEREQPAEHLVLPLERHGDHLPRVGREELERGGRPGRGRAGWSCARGAWPSAGRGAARRRRPAPASSRRRPAPGG